MKNPNKVENSQLEKEFKKVIVYNYLVSSTEEVSLELKKGVVIKIDSFYQKGQNYHNCWATILSYNNNEYRVAVESSNVCYEIINIKYENIKWIIGTLEMDCVNIGKDRHQKEIVTLINNTINL